MEPRLREATGDLSWLLSRGYADPSGLKLVGDRYALTARQRVAVMRCACSDEALRRRREHQVSADAVAGQMLAIDGYNVLTTVEAALAGGVVIVGRDGAWRDMASMHGTYRKVEETVPALELTGEVLAGLGVVRVVWYLDSPVSNSGRLKGVITQVAHEHGWEWTVQVVQDPDAELIAAGEIVATADSVILDGCGRWFGLADEVVARRVPQAHVLRLG
jgi:hypothetical protein